MSIIFGVLLLIVSIIVGAIGIELSQAFSLSCETCCRKVKSEDKYYAWCGADIQEEEPTK